tara:strand:- start:2728 stop:2991 length:264 start_codon:yes stop_codon:yes gene_type:complete
MSSFETIKKTNDYVIGKSFQGNYLFFDINNEQLYYIDFFMNRYMTAGYGKGGNEIKQKVLKMMAMLKKGQSQKDVVKYLIEQSKYDF